MITTRLVLRKDKETSDGSCPIAICVTINRKRAYTNTGHRVPLDFWEGDRVKKGYPNHDILNLKLSNKLNEVKKEILNKQINNEGVTLQNAKALSSDKRVDFIAYADKVLEEIKSTKAKGTYLRYRNELRRIGEYSSALNFAEITPVYLTKYQKWMQSCGTDVNTTIAAFKFIRLVINHAKSVGVVTYYPFKEWKFPKYKETNKIYLTHVERASIKKFLQKKEATGHLQLVGAYFLLECYSGIRFSDWRIYMVERIAATSVMYLRTTKTGARITIPLDSYPDLKWTVDYIKRHKLVYTLNMKDTNIYLKALAACCGIAKNLTTHVGRHTAATLLLEAGMSRESIAQVLGVSVKIVDTYAKFTSIKLTQEFERLRL